MTFWSVPPALASAIFLALAIAVLVNNPRSPVNLTYFAWAMLTVWWHGSWALLFNVSDPAVAAVLVRVGYSGIIFLPVAYYHFVASFLGLHRRRFVLGSYFCGAVFLALNWTTDLFVGGYYSYSWGFYPKAGILHPAYLAFLTVVAVHGTALSYRSYRREDLPIRRNQLSFMFIGNLIYCAAAVDFLTNYGFDLYPVGFVFNLVSAVLHFYLIMFTYAFYRLRLMDLSLALRYSAMFTYYAGLVSLPSVLAGFFSKSWAAASGAGAVSALLSPFLFPGLMAQTSKAVDSFVRLFGNERKVHHLESDFAKSSSVEECVAALLRCVREIFDPVEASAFIWDDRLQQYTFRSGFGPEVAAVARRSIMAGSALLPGWTNGRSILIREALASSDTIGSACLGAMEAYKAFITAPLFCNGRLAGILHLGARKGCKIYNDLDLQLIQRWITLAEMNLARIAHYELEKEASRDFLTGSYNRRKIMDYVSRAVECARSRDESACVILADIDHFKMINDTHGHQTGDLVLQSFANLISSCVRYFSSGTDRIGTTGRLGGEEFLIVLPGTSKAQALLVAERIMDEVRRCRVTSLTGAEIRFTVSLGISEYPDDGKDTVRLIQVADEMMYKAKSEGRNRVAMSGGAVVAES